MQIINKHFDGQPYLQHTINQAFNSDFWWQYHVNKDLFQFQMVQTMTETPLYYNIPKFYQCFAQ